MAKKIWLGSILILVILTTSFYMLMPDKVRIDFTKTRTIFRVYEEGKFVISGIEYTRIFDGTKLMRAKNRTRSYDIKDKTTEWHRVASFKDKIIAEDFYKFDNEATDVETVPISHMACFTNAQGKIFEYLISNIEYNGTTGDIMSPFDFGKNMKITFQEGYYRAKVYQQKVRPDKIIVRYRITSDYECFDIRLFDPEEEVIAFQECKNITKERTEDIIGICEVCYNITIIDDGKEFCFDKWFEFSNSTNYCVQEQCNQYNCKTGTKIIEYIEEECNIVFYKYGDEIFNASEWCCYDKLCGLIRDYDCNYIEEQRRQPNHSYKELDTGILKIDATKLENHYYEEKSKLENIDIRSFTIQ